MKPVSRKILATLLGLSLGGAVAATPRIMSHAAPQAHAAQSAPDPQIEPPPLAGEMQDFKLYEPRQAPPPLLFFDADGQPHGLDEFRGKVVLLNFWATWCGPCVAELPTIDALARRPPLQDFVIATVSVDRGGIAAVNKYLDRKQLLAVPRYIDPKGNASRAMGTEAIPASFIIDPKGRLVGTLDGAADWNGPDARKLMIWSAGSK